TCTLLSASCLGRIGEFQRTPVGKRDLLQIPIERPIFGAHAFDLDSLAQRLREIGPANTYSSEPCRGVTLKNPVLRFSIFSFAVDVDNDMRINPVDLRQRARHSHTLGHVDIAEGEWCAHSETVARSSISASTTLQIVCLTVQFSFGEIARSLS